MFGGTTPTIPQQDYIFGNNDLTIAKAARFKIDLEEQYLAQGFTDKFVEREYVPWLFDQVDKFGETSKYINVRPFDGEVWEADFLG